MKKLLLIFSVFLFLPVLNAEENTYFDLPQISVNELPTASSNTLNKIYIYDNNYYITKEESTGSLGTRLSLNTDYGTSILYSNFTDDDCQYVIANFTNNNVAYMQVAKGSNTTSFTNFPYYLSSLTFSTGSTGKEILKCNSNGTLNFAYFNGGNTWYTDSFSSHFIVSQFYGSIGSWVNEHLSTTSFAGSTTYSWELVTEEQVFRVIPTKIYVPSKNLYCYHFIDSNTLRGYISNPVVGNDISYYDFDLNHHYRENEGVESITEVPVCLSNTTYSYWYREDILQILGYFLIFSFFTLFIPIKVFSKLFRRGGL